MKHDRSNKTVNEGIAIVSNALDPLERHTYMIPKSLAKHLEVLVFNSKVKTNKSELVREALKSTYPTYESS